MKDLMFDDVTRANVSRCNRWHKGGIEDWSVQDWAVAMAGEAGEVCNAIKKLRRIEDDIANISEPERQLSTRAEAVQKIGEEIADTFLYLNLLAARLGLSLPEQVVKKFNSVSERYGFPERLGFHPGQEDYRRLYEELIYQVGFKYPDESRHQTALRYLKQAEAPKETAAQAEKSSSA